MKITPHALKNDFYTQCFDKIIESEVNTNLNLVERA